MGFCHLHRHDQFSLLDGMGSSEDAVAKAKLLGQKYLGLTNHGNIDGLIKFQRACLSGEIKPIMGCEFYFVSNIAVKEKGEKRHHLTVLIKNAKGFQNVCRLLTIANMEGFYYKPRIDLKLLCEHKDGLVVLSGCSVGILGMDLSIVRKLHEVFKKDFYLEVMPHDFQEQKDINRIACDLADSDGIPLVATNDSHYNNVGDAESHEVLLAMQTQAKWSDQKRFRFSTKGLFLCSEKQMVHKFIRQGVLTEKQIDSAINNTIVIAKKCCGFIINKQQVFLPDVPAYHGKLQGIAKRKLYEITSGMKDSDKKIYRERLAEELLLIENKGFIPYFCIIKELIDWCKDNDIMVGVGRGCFLKKSKVLFYSNGELSYRNIEEIVKGDFIISHLGDVAIVEDTFQYEIEEEIVDIYVNGRLIISCTKDHKIFTSDGWKDAGCLSEKDRIINCGEIYKKRINQIEKQKSDIDEKKSEENSRKDFEGRMAYFKRCKTLSKKVKTILFFYLQKMREYFTSSYSESCIKKKWIGIYANMQQMYFNRSNQFSRVEIEKFRSSKDSSKQIGNKIKTKTISIDCAKTRSNFGFAQSKGDEICKYSRGNCKESCKTQREDDQRSSLCKEIRPTWICFWKHQWNTISIIFRNWIYSSLHNNENTDTKMCDKYSVQKYGEQEKDIQARFSDRKFNCRNKGLDTIGDSSEGSICQKILQTKWSKVFNFVWRRFGEIRDYSYQQKRTNETGINICEESSNFEMVEKIKYRRYKGKVYDLKTETRSYNVNGYGVHNSVGGSLFAYTLGITNIDPIKYNLLFSRFLNSERNDLPDVDMDFEDAKREQVKDHLKFMYGENNVASISTFMKMKGKAIIRDVSRVFDVPLKDADSFAKNISYYEDGDVIKAACQTEYGKYFVKKYPHVIEHALKLEGLRKSSGQHAAACIVSADDLTKGTKGNLAIRKGQVVSNWDMEDSEHMGLMKLDVLGLNTLTVLNAFVKEVKNSHGINIDFRNIPLDDQKVYQQIAEGCNVGIFQISGYSTNALTSQIQAENILELSNLVALSRPGTMDSGMTNLYIQRLQDGDWDKKHPVYEKITEQTKGIIIYQEQVMEVIYKIAGLPYSIADKIRKIIAKKRDVTEFKQYESMFIEGCLKQGYFNKQEAIDFWEILQAHNNYSFNKSHAVAYAITAYWTAYARCHYPVEFICALLNYGSNDDKKKNEYIIEANRLGLDIRLPALRKSDPMLWKVHGDVLYIPFIEIKGVGEKMIEKCMVELYDDADKDQKGFFKEKSKKPKSNRLRTILATIEELKRDGNYSALQAYFAFSIL